VILSKDRARKASKKAGGGTLKSAWQLQFTVQREFAYDLDMRKVIDYVSLQIMEYYRLQLIAGKRASGRGDLPKTRQKTKEKFGGGRHYGFRSGFMADHWWRGKIRGGSVRSFVLVKPWGGKGGPGLKFETKTRRDFIINAGLRRTPPVDYQSVRGKARQVLQQAFDEAISAGFGVVTTMRSPDTRGGTLPEIRK
jgi:hypothetical protein